MNKKYYVVKNLSLDPNEIELLEIPTIPSKGILNFKDILLSKYMIN